MAFLPGGPIGHPHPGLDPGLANDIPMGGMSHFPAPIPPTPMIGVGGNRYTPPVVGVPMIGPGKFPPVPIAPHPINVLPSPMQTATPPHPSGDATLAHNISQHLSDALAAVRDPELRQSLATAMATLHKYVAARHKEHLDALAGKASVRHLADVYGTHS